MKSLALLLPTALLFASASAPAQDAGGLSPDWTVSEVGGPRYVHSQPHVGATGRVVWRAYGTGKPGDSEGTFGVTLLTWKTGTLLDLSTENLHAAASPSNPKVFGDRVVWNAVREINNDAPRPHTWVLREVPDGDSKEGQRDYPYRELEAFYVNANRLIAQGREGDFNLRPVDQTYEGPLTNYAQYLAAYRQPDSVKITNVFGVVENLEPRADGWSESDENAFRERLAEGEIKDDYTDAVSLTARRRTLTYGEIVSWSEEDGITWETWDTRNDFSADVDGDLMAWQKAKAYPFGWEIMARKGEERFQITTNFYYDMAPKVYKDEVVWYGWDGNDYEIYSWSVTDQQVRKVTDNNFDDVSPVVGEAGIVWESYETPDASILFRPRGSQDILGLSVNYEPDTQPTMDGDRIIWQGYDGDDHEIYLFEASKFTGGPDDQSITQITANQYEDINPSIQGNHIVWMGYHDQWDAEIFVYDLTTRTTSRLTDNDVEDRNPAVGGGVVAWETVGHDGSRLHVATQK